LAVGLGGRVGVFSGDFVCRKFPGFGQHFCHVDDISKGLIYLTNPELVAKWSAVMNRVVSFSTGLSSALACERVLAKFNPNEVNEVYVVFMDTLIEDEDNYRFAGEVYQRWAKLYPGWQHIRLTEGVDPYEVADKHNMIFNQRRHPCTRVLKIEPFMRWLETLDGPSTVYIGFDYSELHRTEATTRNYEEAGYGVDYPLLWRPVEERDYSQVARDDWEIEPPRMYGMGYSHANCGGRCVAMGQKDWLLTLINFPERFAQVEEWERQMRKREGPHKYAILRRSINGISTPMTLEELRERYLAGKIDRRATPTDSSCVVCGIGAPVEHSI
jgi:hypothetical protein